MIFILSINVWFNLLFFLELYTFVISVAPSFVFFNIGTVFREIVSCVLLFINVNVNVVILVLLNKVIFEVIYFLFIIRDDCVQHIKGLRFINHLKLVTITKYLKEQKKYHYNCQMR